MIELLPNAPIDLVNRIKGVVAGGQDDELRALLGRSSFGLEVLQSDTSDDQKAGILLEAVVKAQSYDEAVEKNRGKEIEFVGFEDDPDVVGTKDFIYEAFGKELLEECLIAQVKYTPNIVNVQIDRMDYMLPVEVYKGLEEQVPEVKSHKFRAESYPKWNTDPNFSKKFIALPINLYSFYGETPNGLTYLADAPKASILRLYKLGTVAHEVAHHIYEYMLVADIKTSWVKVVEQTGAITAYARSYDNHELKYEEAFGEAIRLQVTMSGYLKTNFPLVADFLENNLPTIANRND